MAMKDTAGVTPEPQRSFPSWLVLDFSQAGGHVDSMGQQSLVGRFGSHFTAEGELKDATVSILARDEKGAWQVYERPVTLEHATAIATLVHSLGMPTREPDLEVVVEPIMAWCSLSLP